MAKLPIDYRDDVLNISVNERRKFNMIQNDDGTVSFEDVTTYESIGSEYGASDINRTNSAVNKLDDKMSFLTGGFLLKDVAVTFSNKKFTLDEPRVTENSLAMIYWNDDCKNDIYDAKVVGKTTDGAIVFESEGTIVKTCNCSIYVIAESEE